MKRSIFLLSFALLLSACGEKDKVNLAAVPMDKVEQGVALIPTYCNTCHGLGENEIDDMLAPPLWGVRAHYLARYSDPEAFVDAMAGYIAEPEIEKSLMPLAVNKYGLKAPVSLTDEEISAVAWAIYAGRVERPSWSREYQKRHRDCDAVW